MTNNQHLCFSSPLDPHSIWVLCICLIFTEAVCLLLERGESLILWYCCLHFLVIFPKRCFAHSLVLLSGKLVSVHHNDPLFLQPSPLFARNLNDQTIYGSLCRRTSPRTGASAQHKWEVKEGRRSNERRHFASFPMQRREESHLIDILRLVAFACLCGALPAWTALACRICSWATHSHTLPSKSHTRRGQWTAAVLFQPFFSVMMSDLSAFIPLITSSCQMLKQRGWIHFKNKMFTFLSQRLQTP